MYTNLRHLDGNVVESEVVTVFSGRDYWRNRIEDLGIRVDSLDCAGYRDITSGVSRLGGRLREFRPEIVHTHLWTANVTGRIAGRRAGVPVISTIHCPEYEAEASSGVPSAVRRKIKAARLLDKWTARFGCWRMIAVSKYIKESLTVRLNYPPEKVDVLYNPVDIFENPVLDDRSSVFESLGLPPDTVLLLSVARLSPEKGLIHAIRAMPDILEAEPRVRLVSVGPQDNEEYKSFIHDEIAALNLTNAVVFAGERRDIGSLLASCDVFLFPSLFEGLGIALAEAMMAGRACVASRIRPLDEFVEDGGNGLFFEAAHPEEMAKAVVSLIRDGAKREAIGKAAAATAAEMFQPEPAARRLAEIYRSVLEN